MAPKTTDPEVATVVCQLQRICDPGEWTEAVGDRTTDTKCTVCSPGRFRALAATQAIKETETDVCAPHKTCDPGEWTEAVGDSTTDTKCTVCSAGRFRDTAPTAIAKETENEVCVLKAITIEPDSVKDDPRDNVATSVSKVLERIEDKARSTSSLLANTSVVGPIICSVCA